MKKLTHDDKSILMQNEKEYMKDTHYKRFWRLRVLLWFCKMNRLAVKYNLNLYHAVSGGHNMLPYERADGNWATYEFSFKDIPRLWSNPEELIKEIIISHAAKSTALIAISIRLPLCDYKGHIDSALADYAVLRKQ